MRHPRAMLIAGKDTEFWRNSAGQAVSLENMDRFHFGMLTLASFVPSVL